MIDYELEQEKTVKLRREVRFTNRIAMFSLALLIILPIAYSMWSDVRVSNLHIVGDSTLCPGEKLEIEYYLSVNSASILVRDWTTWSIDPPLTKLFSTAERFIVESELDQRIKRTWRVPEEFLNTETDEIEPMPPGKYRRILAVSSPSRSSSISIAAIDFEILGECE